MGKTNNVDKIVKPVLSKLDEEISLFKQRIEERYDINLYIAIPRAEVYKTPSVSLSDLWDLTFELIKDNNPELLPYKDVNIRNRTRVFMNYLHAFAYIARNKLFFTYESIGEFVKRRHCSIMNSVKVAKTYIDLKDVDFLTVYDELIFKLNQYVGGISEDPKV